MTTTKKQTDSGPARNRRAALRHDTDGESATPAGGEQA
jgi:hypothetical protein